MRARGRGTGSLLVRRVEGHFQEVSTYVPESEETH